MRLTVFSHKVCWRDPAAPSGFVTDGGFPRQMDALASLFDQTTLLIRCDPGPPPHGAAPLTGRDLRVEPLPPLRSRGLLHRLLFPLYCLRILPRVWRSMRTTEVVHAMIPGDVGTVGIWAARWFRKRLFVRYCGNWNQTSTPAQRWWKRLMTRRASEHAPMFATGGAQEPPSPGNPHIHWVFATTLTEAELAALGEGARRRDAPSMPIRLITVGRQEAGKGVEALLSVVATLHRQGTDVRLDVVGGGSQLAAFRQRGADLGLADVVAFRGNLPREGVLEHLRGADVFVLLSRSEGFPKVVIEAMSTGLPVVVTPVSVLPLLLEEGGGMLVDASQPEAVAGAIEQLTSDGPRYLAHRDAALRTAARHSLEAWARVFERILTRAWGPLRRAAG